MNWIKALDWIVVVVLMLVGIWMVVSQWPNVSWWAWLCCGLGIVGVPLNIFNPVQKLRTWVLRLMVKR